MYASQFRCRSYFRPFYKLRQRQRGLLLRWSAKMAPGHRKVGAKQQQIFHWWQAKLEGPQQLHLQTSLFLQKMLHKQSFVAAFFGVSGSIENLSVWLHCRNLAVIHTLIQEMDSICNLLAFIIWSMHGTTFLQLIVQTSRIRSHHCNVEKGFS